MNQAKKRNTTKAGKIPSKNPLSSDEILKIAEVIILLLDKKARVLMINRKGCEVLGFSEREILGKDWFSNFIPERYGQKVKKVFKEIMSGKKKFSEHFENPIITKDGVERLITWRNAPIKKLSGEILYSLSSGVDITAIRREEDLLQKSEESCRADDRIIKTEERFRQVVLSAGEWIWEVDKNGLYIYSSGVIENILGYTPEEVVGKKHFYDFFMPNEKDKLKKKALAMFSKKEKFKKFVNKNVHKNGKLIYLETSGMPTFDEKGNLTGYIGADTDITKHIEAKEHLEKTHRELLKSTKRLKELVTIDPHTGLYNHRYLEKVIEAEFSRSKRAGEPLSLVMVDIDYFKSINDVYGHEFGDLVLKQLATQLKRMVRQYDVVVRFSGEEFAILSPGSDRESIIQLAQRILDAINLFNFGNKEHLVKLKLSVAVSAYPDDRITRPSDLIERGETILAKAKELGGNRVCSSKDLLSKTAAFTEAVEQVSETKLLTKKIDKLTTRANQNLVESIYAFAKTIELKDYDTGLHVERTVKYATEIAEALNMSKDSIERIRKAAILHDLGKVGISENLLKKPAKLTQEEMEIIKQHPQIGVDIIRPIQYLHDIIPFILHHHERWDGKGYPHGLQGEEIPLGARVIALADAFQALTSDRPYRKAYSKDKAIDIVKKEAGISFDPEIVRVFLELLKKQKRSDNNEKKRKPKR
ncbi:MAG: diguanylate cyclase [Candidatus Omnitrophica bacterium]|nr:diguanylate cyclase [Candidatus Omnitrophota bacterium]